MKICFEGPSAVGKTTMSSHLQNEYYVVSEVNELFGKNSSEGKFWYYDRQVERCVIAADKEKVIFDGDPFQPLWYNWTYSYPEGYLSLEPMLEYYREKIKDGKMSFPDLYVVFLVSEENLRQRKEADSTRSRGNFEKHLKLIHSQRKYFGFLLSTFPGLIEFVQSIDFDATIEKVRNLIPVSKQIPRYDDLVILTEISLWLRANNSDGVL